MYTIVMKRCILYAMLVFMGSSNALAKTCTVSSSGVAFGVYDPTSAASLNTIGSLTVDCNGSIYAELSLSVGNGAGANYITGRKMTRIGGGTLVYNLYDNASRTQVLGDGTNNSVTHIIYGLRSYTQSIWGRMPARQSNVLAGSYADTLVATISY